MKVSTIAIIPARGTSKRIPHKNIKNFLGKPIIQYSIKAAQNSDCFDEIMVSTEDEKVSSIAKKFGASTPFLRSAKNSENGVPLSIVLEEVLLKYRNINKDYEYCCCILPTAPFVSGENIKKSYELLKSSGADAVIPVVKFSYPIQRAFINENGNLKMIYPKNINVNSQDLIPAYHDAGQFYWINVNSFFKQKKIFMNKCIPIEISELEAQDIDNIEDWKIAEVKYSLLKQQC